MILTETNRVIVWFNTNIPPKKNFQQNYNNINFLGIQV